MRRAVHGLDADDAVVGPGENEPLVKRRSKTTARSSKAPKEKTPRKLIRGRSADVRGHAHVREVSPGGHLIGASLPMPPGSNENAPRQRSMEPMNREVSFDKLLNQFRQAEDATLNKKRTASRSRNAPRKTLTQENLVELEEMQRLVREMTKKYEGAEKRAEAAELEARRAEEQLAEESRSRRDIEQLRAQAAARVEELELVSLKFQADREEWKQREAELQETGNSMLQEFQTRDQSALQARDERIEELENLLKQAIFRGAKIGKEKADIETSHAELERKMSKIKASVKTKMRRDRKRLEAIIINMAQRAERAEDRMVEYLDASTLGADALAERHMRHLMEVCHELAEKVDEQADIIDALRTLLHDHKDFIRSEMLNEPHTRQATVSPGAIQAGNRSYQEPLRQAMVSPGAMQAGNRKYQEASPLRVLGECIDLDSRVGHEADDALDVDIASPEQKNRSKAVVDDAESSLGSFDDEIFCTSEIGLPPAIMPMPSDSTRRDIGTARERKKKKDSDDDWPW